MGTMLQKSGLGLGEIPEKLNIEKPEVVMDIHRQYLEAGSQIISANTFGANGYKLKDCPYSVEEIISAGIRNAKEAVGGKALVALDIGPIGQLLEPAGSLSFDKAYDYFKEEILAGKGADVIYFETFTDLLEVKAGVLAAKENSDKPVVVSMTFERNGRTFAGAGVKSAALTLTGLGVDALGVNCSLGPAELEPIVRELTEWTDKPIFVKPNAGLPDPNSNTYDVTAEQFADCMDSLMNLGTVKLVGGCCGTTPDYIRELKSKTESRIYKKADYKKRAAVCSGTTAVEICEPRIIGERINPTGKKLFKEALKNNDIDYILSQAISQVEAGADILLFGHTHMPLTLYEDGLYIMNPGSCHGYYASYGIIDIKMRMLKIAELKRIMGFPEDYVLIGTQAEQKKFIGNAVEVNMSRVLCETLCMKLSEYQKMTI